MLGILLGTGNKNKNIKPSLLLKNSQSSERNGLVNKQLGNSDSW